MDAADGPYDALILAAAGVHRMGRGDRITAYLPPMQHLYAVSQGALGIECRAGDEATLALLAPLRHVETTWRCWAERAFMRRLEGGCSVPIGTCSTLSLSPSGNADQGTQNVSLWIKGCVVSVDGASYVSAERQVSWTLVDEGPLETDMDKFMGRCEGLGQDLANDLLAKGAKPILDALAKHHA